MSRPPRRLRRRTWRVRRRWHRIARPLRRPARAAVALAILAVAALGLSVRAQLPDLVPISGSVRLGPDSTAVLDPGSRGDLVLAGLRPGDRIVAVDGSDVDAARAAALADDRAPFFGAAGDTLRLTTARGGAVREVPVVAGRQDARDARQFGLSARVVSRASGVLFALAVLAFVVAGAVLFVRSRARGYGASLATALLAVGGGFGFTALTRWDAAGVGMPVAAALMVVAIATFVSALPAIAAALVRFPDGRFEPPWTRWVGRAAALGLAVLVALMVAMVQTGSPALEVAGAVVLVALIALPAVGLVQKYRRTPDTVVRQQMKWVLLPLGAFITVIVLTFGAEAVPAFDVKQSATGYLSDTVLMVLTWLTLAAVPVGVLAGALGFRPWDADLWIARSLAVGAATLGLAAVFAGGAEALRIALRASMGDGADAVAAALAAVAALVVFNPVREWLTRRADADLVRTRERLGERLPLLLAGRQVVASPAEIGRVALAAVHEVFQTRRAAVFDLDPDGWEVVAADGLTLDEAHAWAEATLDAPSMPACSVQVWEDPAFVLRVPLRSAEDELVGVLALGTHGRGRGYSTEERRALDGAARPLAEALRVAERREEDRVREYDRLARLVDRAMGAGDGAARPVADV